MDNTTQNHVFGRFWDQAARNSFDRSVERAANSQGRRAIKFKTDGMHKVLVFEVGRRPGFDVRLCGFPEVPGVISGEGIVHFAGPVGTISLGQLIGQIDRWAQSFETIFGEVDDDGIEATRSLSGQAFTDVSSSSEGDDLIETTPASEPDNHDREGLAEAPS